MHNDTNAKSVNINAINSLLLIISDNLRSHKSRSTTFGKNDMLFVVESGETVIYDLQALNPCIFIQRLLLLKQDILRLDIPMHNALFLQIIKAL